MGQVKRAIAPDGGGDLRRKAAAIYTKLKKAHPDATIALDFSNPLELAVATILSAQCTDAKVNEVTPKLFSRAKTPAEYLKISPQQLETILRPTGFFRQKAKNILALMRILREEHGGKLPSTMEQLTALPGVGRKTANVILGNAFGIPGLPVDTHVGRVSRRLGLTDNEDPVKVEADLCALLPKKEWTHFSHTLIFHGRRICKARKPECIRCPVSELCDYFKMNV